MIFVSLGTQDKSFKRLLQEIEKLINERIICEKVIVQAGYTKFKTEKMEIIDYVAMDKFKKYINDSNFVIVHGGVGSILDGIKSNKKVIAVPRLKKFDEHENDHQIQIVNNFARENYIIGCQSVDDLKDAIIRIDNFIPAKFKSNNSKFVKLIDSYIEENL